MEKRGGRKTSRRTPLPKRGSGPSRTVRFPPPRVSLLLFSCTDPTTEQTRSSFGRVQKFFWRVFSGMFSYPHTFCTLPYHCPRFLGRGCDEALFSEEKGVFSEKGGGNSVNQGFGQHFYRKGNSVKRFGPFTEPPDTEN